MQTEEVFDVAGLASGHAIVFVHGMRVARRMWEPQMKALASEYRVIAMDLPGHGSLRNEPFHVEQAVETLAKIIDQAASGRALVVGISLGGYVAMELGAKYPKKAAGLVIASASVEPSGWYNLPYRILSALMANAPNAWLSWINRTVFNLVYGKRRAEPLVSPGFFMHGAAAGLREVMKRKFAPKLAAYSGPVLLLNGAWDFGFRMHERRLLATAQKGQLEVIPKAFHIANIDQPQAFSAAIRRFAGTIPW